MKPLLLTLFILTSTTLGFSQGLTSAQLYDLAQRTRQAFNVPGIAVGVVKDGKGMHAQGYGVRTVEQPGENRGAHALAESR